MIYKENIFYITCESQEARKNSPHLEGFAAKGIEVLLLSDPIDDFWISSMFEGYEDKKFSSVTKGSAELENIEGAKDKGAKDKKREKK